MKIGEFIDRLLSGFAPKQRLSPNSWNEKHRSMEPGAAKAGRWRSYEFQKEPLDAISDSSVRKVTLQWCSQFCGKSAVITGQLGWLIDQAPTPVLLVNPTESGALSFMRSRLNPLLESTPCLSSVIDSTKSRSGVQKGLGSQQLLRKTYPGGWLLAGGSNSARQLRAHAAQVVILDEIDAFEDNFKEGDIATLARQRSATFKNSYSLAASTPTFTNASRIEAEYLLSDQRHWHCRCPYCGQWDWLKFSMVRWEKIKNSAGDTIQHKPETARIVCNCGHDWTEQDRINAVKGGRWVPDKPEVTGHRGYHLNALNVLLPCPNGRSGWMEEIAIRFLEAKAIGTQGLKPFKNLILAETWAPESHLPPEPIRLYERRELLDENADELILPEEALLLTCGVDTQDDRCEITTAGWCAEDELWILEHKILYGDPSKPELWNEVDSVLRRKWLHPRGQRLYPELTLIDSGGHHAKSVYDFVYRCAPRKVFCSKGYRGYTTNFVRRSQGANSRLFLIQVSSPKDRLAKVNNETEFLNALYDAIGDLRELGLADSGVEYLTAGELLDEFCRRPLAGIAHIRRLFRADSKRCEEKYRGQGPEEENHRS
jgi:phage terminase large subunit GpA-like protein